MMREKGLWLAVAKTHARVAAHRPPPPVRVFFYVRGSAGVSPCVRPNKKTHRIAAASRRGGGGEDGNASLATRRGSIGKARRERGRCRRAGLCAQTRALGPVRRSEGCRTERREHGGQ